MSVFCLSCDEIDEHWPKFEHHLLRLEREGGLVLAAKIRADLRDGIKQVWGYQESGQILGIAVTEIFETPKRRSVKTMGTSTPASPALTIQNFSSTRKE